MIKMEISVIVCTKNRPTQLLLCLNSIVNSFVITNAYDYELLIVDQSDTPETATIIDFFKKTHHKAVIRYFHLSTGGLSCARNLGITHARSDIICFTDDDCIVIHNWQTALIRLFKDNPQVDIAFCRVLPYQPARHKDLYPASVNNFRQRRLFRKPRRYHRFIFTGNAMSFRRTVFKEVGMFKEWLGLGSIGQAAEDEELIYRSLQHGCSVIIEPNIVVYHNQWLTKNQVEMKYIRYTCGFYAAFSYHAFSDPIAREYLLTELFDIFFARIKHLLKAVRELNMYAFIHMCSRLPLEAYYICCGLFIGVFHRLLQWLWQPNAKDLDHNNMN